jgi:hypothetical protein
MIFCFTVSKLTLANALIIWRFEATAVFEWGFSAEGGYHQRRFLLGQGAFRVVIAADLGVNR